MGQRVRKRQPEGRWIGLGAARLGQHLDKQELGGWEIQTRSGAMDHAVDTEVEAFACARRFLFYLPLSVHGLPPVLPCEDNPDRRE